MAKAGVWSCFSPDLGSHPSFGGCVIPHRTLPPAWIHICLHRRCCRGSGGLGNLRSKLLCSSVPVSVQLRLIGLTFAPTNHLCPHWDIPECALIGDTSRANGHLEFSWRYILSVSSIGKDWRGEWLAAQSLCDAFSPGLQRRHLFKGCLACGGSKHSLRFIGSWRRCGRLQSRREQNIC